MPHCFLLENCIFFNDQAVSQPTSIDNFKKQYCLKDLPCARYLVFISRGVDYIPQDLFPNDIEQAQALIGKA